MVIAWTIAGFIIGWVVIEIITAFTKAKFPCVFNFALGFVGGLTAFTITTYYLS